MSTFIQSLIAIAGAFTAFAVFFKWQTKIKDKLDVLEKEVLTKEETDKLIKLYTDPLKEDLRVTRDGIEKLMTQFHNLEIMIARELGSLDGAYKVRKEFIAARDQAVM